MVKDTDMAVSMINMVVLYMKVNGRMMFHTVKVVTMRMVKRGSKEDGEMDIIICME